MLGQRKRDKINEIMTSKHKLDGNCMICHSKKAVISCNDCRKQHLCEVCDPCIHEDAPLHNRISYAKFIQPIPPTNLLNNCYEIISAGMFFFHYRKDHFNIIRLYILVKLFS